MELQGHLNANRTRALQQLQVLPQNRIPLWGSKAEADPVRFTLMTPGGTVLDDSHLDPAAIINLSHGTDVQDALEQGWGHAQLPEISGDEGRVQVLSTALYEDNTILGILRASEPLTGNQARQRHLFHNLAFAQILTLLLISGILQFVSFRRSRPFRDLFEDVAKLQQGEHCQPRIPHGDAIEPIATELNRLQRTANHQQRVIADQRHRQRVLLNHMSEGILAIDNHQAITEINPLAAEWLRQEDPLRVPGKSLHSVTRNPRLLELVSTLIEEGQTIDGDIVLANGDEERILHIRGSQMIDADQAVGVLVVMRDVTELRKLASLRTDFVANVSHELRTPLTSIRGYAELILDEPGAQEAVVTFSEKIVAQSTRMVTLMNDLLDLTRIETAQETPAFTQSQIRPILQTVLEQCSEAANLRNLSFALTAPDDLAAKIHPPLFEQAIFNLVQNAVKYTHPETSIELSAHIDADQLRVLVRDHGPGISPSHHDRLFERFYRVDKARSRAAGGTGLGLSIVKHIAQSHGGSVSIRSTLGDGCTFIFEIPHHVASLSGT